MKRTDLRLAGLIMAVLLVMAQSVWAKVDYSQEMYEKLARTNNEIPQIKIPDYRKLVLKNGLVVYLAEDHDFPIVLVNGFIRGGRERETLQNAGISALMVDLMNTGTEKYDEAALDNYTELHAVHFQVNSGDRYFSFNGSALATEQEALLSLAAEMLCHPNFQANYFSRIKTEWEKGLQQLETKEDGLLNKYFYQNILPGHPSAFDADNMLRLANLARLTPEKVANYYQQAFLPNQTILVVYGDFDPQLMERTVTKYFGGWVGREVTPASVATVEHRASFGRILLINKPDAVQAKIKMGYRFIDAAVYERDLEAKAAFEIGNQIFGVGFGSYLMDEIRSQRGYAYDITAEYYCRDWGGVYQINTRVRPDQACETVAVIKQIMQATQSGRKKVAAAEVEKLINRKNASFPENFCYRDEAVNRQIESLEIQNRPADYFNRYLTVYNRVTAVQVQAALERWLFPEKLLTVIVGKKEDILPAFRKAGIEVTVVEPITRSVW